MPPKRPRTPGPPPWAKGHAWGFTQARFRRHGPPWKSDYLLDLAPQIPDITMTGRRGLPQREGDVSRRFRTFPFPRVIAPGIEVLEDFEAGELIGYTGDTGSFSVGSGYKYEGNYGCRGISNPGTQSINKFGALTAAGETLSAWLYLPAGGGPDRALFFQFGVQDRPNHYRFGISTIALQLQILKNGVGVIASVGLGSIAPDTWYKLTLTWSVGGNMSLRWSGGAESCSGNDTDYASGGIGFAISTIDDPGKITWLDYYVKE